VEGESSTLSPRGAGGSSLFITLAFDLCPSKKRGREIKN